MQCQWDADFRDERQCYDYSRLAGVKNDLFSVDTADQKQNIIVPDLAELSDEVGKEHKLN